LDSGRVIYAKDIKTSDSLPYIILILDIPNKTVFK